MDERTERRLSPYIVSQNKVDLQAQVRSWEKLRALCFHHNEKIGDVMNRLVEEYLESFGADYVLFCEKDFNDFLRRKKQTHNEG